MCKISSFAEAVEKRNGDDGLGVYDPNYIPTEEEINDPAAFAATKQKLREMNSLPPDMWEPEDFRNYYEIKKREVGKKVAWEMICDRINEIRNQNIVVDEYGFPWDATEWGDYGGEIRMEYF
ncbi:MAG: hypothetical protein IK016_07185 [Lachnospiraceae bacterium]|nr:hypothetical protein [Lachnospiraceae bacterium]